jgi:hypothetical protein
VDRTLLSAAFDFEVAFDFPSNKNVPRVPHPCAFFAQEPALSEAEGVGFLFFITFHQ